MRWGRKLKLPKTCAHHEEALSDLRDAVVSGVKHAPGSPVANAMGLLFKIIESVPVNLVGKTCDVLKKKGAWLEITKNAQVAR
jgi:hypothetical protein